MTILNARENKTSVVVGDNKTNQTAVPLCIIILLSFITFSCKENVSPKGPFTQKYILYSLINYDSTFQTAYLSHNYDVDNYDPLENETDPAMEGAVITLTVNSKDIYAFQEGTIPRTDTTRYKTPVKYYYIDNYKPESLDKIAISAKLTNGVELKSSTVVPPVSFVSFNFNYFYNPNTANNLTLGWNSSSTKASNINKYYAPLLEIVYSKADNPNTKIRVKVPLYFIPSNQTWMPIYPGVVSTDIVHYYRDGIVRVLNSISEGDPQKENYIFHFCEFSLLMMDENLAFFVAAENTFKEEFSVRIEVPDYSNIENGLGLFGAYGRRKSNVIILSSYLKSLGYQTSY
jgi:hypothetical protein